MSNANGNPAMGFAEALQKRHENAHAATVRDASDEDELSNPSFVAPGAATTATAASPATEVAEQPVASASAAGSARASAPIAKPTSRKAPVPLDVKSEELFPTLGGAPKPRMNHPAPSSSWGSGRQPSLVGNSARMAAPTSVSLASQPPAPPVNVAPRILTLPGQHIEKIRFAPSQMLPRDQLKKPIRHILSDTDKRSKATVDMHSGPGGSVIFEGKGSVDAVRQALKEIAQQVGSKQYVRVPVPASCRFHIIGRGGSTVQGIHERTGARVTVPKKSDTMSIDDNDDSVTIDVLIEGDAVAAELARREIETIVREHSSNISMRVKTIPPEFFPFLAGVRNANLDHLQQRLNVQIKIPQYKTWSVQPPPPEDIPGKIQFAAAPDQYITISGDRSAAQEARTELERRAAVLQRDIALRVISMNRGQHQFILGDAPDALERFMEETGCSLVFPPEHDDTENLAITGPVSHIETGVNHAMDLATRMRMSCADITRQFPTSPTHGQAITNYLREHRLIEEIEKTHNAHIVIPKNISDGPVVWEIYSADGKNAVLARTDVLNLIRAHPPSKVVNVTIDPCFHPYIRENERRTLKSKYGVHMMLPEILESPKVTLLYEGQNMPDAQSLRRAPTSEEAVAFEKLLADAKAHILSVVGDQNDLTTRGVVVPIKFHEKLFKYIFRELSTVPVRIRERGEEVQIRGHTDDVNKVAENIIDFVAEQEHEEHERGYITSFAFPAKFANQLIGRKGENINMLRDEFDVNIDYNDSTGMAEVQGPKAKAHAAQARITALAKKLEDIANYTIKVPAEYHRDLIGARGNQVNRLQDRYNVHVQFPRASNVTGDNAAVTGQQSRIAQAADEIIIRGPRKGADATRDELLSLYQWIVDHSHGDSVSVAQSQIPLLIGTGGREMDKLRTDTGAHIDVPNSNDIPDEHGRVQLKIKGTKTQVNEARSILLAKAKEFDATVSKTIDVDRSHHKALIGKMGSNIRRILANAGDPSENAATRMVKFPSRDSDDTTIRLEGNGVVVDKVIAAIEESVRELEDRVVEVMQVPVFQHRVLIGRNGDTRRNIESQFNVQVDVPKVGSNRTEVKIRGPAESVQQAKEHINTLLQDQYSETVQVPRHLHHVVSDNGAFIRHLRRNVSVNVDHAGAKLPEKQINNAGPGGSQNPGTTNLPLIIDDPASTANTYSWNIVENNVKPAAGEENLTIPWVLSGARENVTRAKSEIEKAVKSTDVSSATGYLVLPDPRKYRFVIGPGGGRINEIRKRTGCKIQVPKSHNLGEAIEIDGPKEHLQEACDLVLEAADNGELLS